MKKQSILISNFKFNHTNSADDSLQIEDFANVNFDNGVIKSELCYSDIFSQIFNTKDYQIFNKNNQELISTLIQIIPYEFFNEATNNKEIRLFALSKNYSLFELNYDDLILNIIYNFSSNPNIILNKNTLYFFEENLCLIINDNNIPQIENMSKCKSFAELESKLYFSIEKQPYKIFKSEILELKNISGNLEQFDHLSIDYENGEICKIVNLKNKLYVITNYAILKYDEDKINFTKTNELKLNIYPNTIEVIDDHLIFYSSNGLYLFDGIDTEKLSNKSPKITKNAKSVCFNQNYYILSPNFEDIIFKFDFDKNYFLPIVLTNFENLYTFSTSENYYLASCISENDNYKNITFYSEENNKTGNQFVKFKSTIFGSTKNKQIKNIYIKSCGEFNLNINSNLTSASLVVSNKNMFENLAINGSVFDIEISSKNYFNIKSILIEYIEVGE